MPKPASHKTAMVNSIRSPPSFPLPPSSCLRWKRNNHKYLCVMVP
uniref:Uncharacterized protein n=1 Tax=Arundo donax TaxID=35708 RepID=A0A0A9EKY1_ARUDO